MLVDIILVVILVLAIIKGFRRGLIVGVFSFVAVIIGLAAAIKLSAVVAGYIGDTIRVSEAWLPVISFAIVFIGVVLLVRLGANLIQKSVELSMLGWVNRLGGVLFYVALYVIVFSIVLFYAGQLTLLRGEALHNSVTYPYISPWGPKVIDALGTVIPFFKGMFADLQEFFGGVAKNIPRNN